MTQLAAWGFTPRGEDHVHMVFRGPHGGTLRVIRSQLGRADPALADKAARLAGVTPVTEPARRLTIRNRAGEDVARSCLPSAPGVA